jgi:hypothetical protein
MKNSKQSLIPLQRASLYLDCEIITPAQKSCLARGSAALIECCPGLERISLRGYAGLSNTAIAGVP